MSDCPKCQGPIRLIHELFDPRITRFWCDTCRDFAPRPPAVVYSNIVDESPTYERVTVAEAEAGLGAEADVSLTRHWAVMVERDGDRVVTIESNCLSGRELSEEDERVIEMAAQNLLGFIGHRSGRRP